MMNKNARMSHCNSFTLIELLVVLAIAGILMGIGLPAFQNLAKGQGTTLAARNLAAKLKAARSYAITKREKIAVLFPNTNLPDKYLCSSYRTCKVSGNSGTYKFEDWIDGEKWNFLPTGTIVSEIDANPNRSTAVINFTPTFTGGENVSSVNCNAIDAAYASQSLHAVVFKPNGTVDTTLNLSIDEGSYVGGGKVQRTNKENPGLNLRVDQFTGRISFGDD